MDSPCSDYIRALQEELKKIEVFQRELPLCMQLVTQAIESELGEKATIYNFIDGRVLKEFIPLMPSSEERLVASGEAEKGVSIGGKPDWLLSARLWNQEVDTGAVEGDPPCPVKPITGKDKKPGGAEGEKHDEVVLTGSNTSDEVKPKEEQSRPHSRKTRRCWSPVLHRRFVHALEKLGGIDVATPKKIKELMEEDGLTSNEIKSHLQKYRLHNRQRPSQAIQCTDNNGHPAPQFVDVVGDRWVGYRATPVPHRPPSHCTRLMHAASSKNIDGDPAKSCSSHTSTVSPRSLNCYY